jgi:hypothetical protein
LNSKRKKSGTGPVFTDPSPLAPERARLKQWWEARQPVTRHWIINILVGIVIQATLVITHFGPFMGAVETAALDRVMRINAILDPPPRGVIAPPQQTFIDIDEATWRDPSWGGGEPYRAPRAQLLAVAAKAFDQGAAQVVLDIAVEGGTVRPAEAADDELFANGLKSMLDSKVIGPRQLLVLVRSMRSPLNGPGASAYLDELRDSPAIDALLAQGDPRLVLAAPYFTYSDDRVLRNWKLFSVACQRGAEGAPPVTRILPSVQLVVLANRIGVPEIGLPWRRSESASCVPFPGTAQTEPVGPDVRARNLHSLRVVTDQYWPRCQDCCRRMASSWVRLHRPTALLAIASCTVPAFRLRQPIPFLNE